MAKQIAALFFMSFLCLCVEGHVKDSLSLGHCVSLQGESDVSQFKKSSHVRVIYFYKKDQQRVRFFLKELDKSAEFLELYGVKVGFCDCTDKENAAVEDCGKTAVEKNVFTYRSGNPLLSLELETMFDVNSIMSNILQLVLLREVPILQTPNEVNKYLSAHRGKHDIIFGHMKAIGTFDHRVFMEVAYAYTEKFKFAICTDKKATTLFEEPSYSDDMSTIWIVWTKSMGSSDKDFTSMQYRGELNLAAFAKFAMTITLPRKFDIPSDGMEHPYQNVDLSMVRFYYTEKTRQDVMEKVDLVAKHYLGTIVIVTINMDSDEAKQMVSIPVSTPTISIQPKGTDQESFLPGKFETDNIAHYMEQMLKSELTSPPQEGEDSDSDPVPGDYEMMDEDQMKMEPEMRDGPDLNIEQVETQDDEVSNLVFKKRNIKMNLEFMPALTDKTFPKTIKSGPSAVIFFYFPFDDISMANLRKMGDASTRLGPEASLVIGRVNCYDWTDVCQKENITIFPTLRLYRAGQKDGDYKGPQDTDAYFSTLKLLELSAPVHLKDTDSITAYMTGDSSLAEISNVSVVGLFRKEDKQELETFKKLASDFYDRIIYAYSDSNEAAKIAKQYDTQLPAVILSKFDDSIQPSVTFSGQFNLANLRTFIQENKLPKLTVLTPLMFPEVRRRSGQLLILFTDGSADCQVPEDAVREIVKTQQYKNVSFTLMPVSSETSVGFKVLNEYSKDPSVPFISYVNLVQGEVFNFDSAVYETAHLSRWLRTAVERSIEPSVVLKEGEWKPANKGYEFLKIMDWEQEKLKKEKGKQRPSRKAMEEVIEDVESSRHMTMMEDEEDADTRKDLVDLVNSRLYHQNQARLDKHRHHEETDGQSHPGAQATSEQHKPMGHDPGEL